MNNSEPFYQKSWLILLLLVVFPPAGIFLLWKSSKWSRNLRISATVLSILWFSILLISAFSSPSSPDQERAALESSAFQAAEPDQFLPQTEPPLSTQEETDEPEATTAESTSRKAPEPTARKSPAYPTTTEKKGADAPDRDTSQTYVLNTNTKKYHRPSCRDVKRIHPENYATSNTIPAGYSPCGHCHP